MRWLKMLNKEEYGSPVCDVCGSKEATHILKDGCDVCCKSCAETEDAFVSKQIFASKNENDYGVEE